MTDGERLAAYTAESMAFDGTDLEIVRPIDHVLALVERVAAGEWWPAGPVWAVATRADAASSCAREVGGGVEVRIATPQATWATAAHELAHAVAGVGAGHGPTFRRAMLDVVEVLTNTVVGERRGRLHVTQLADAYAAAGLHVGERTWPEPTAGDPFAL